MMRLPFVIDNADVFATTPSETTVGVMTEEEFRGFYDRTARPLWAYLSRISGSSQAADDLLQETYYRFLRASADYESESHRRNSLFRIATNLVRDAARRARHRELVAIADEETAGPVLTSTAPIPERQAAMRVDLERAILQLEPLQRELLWLAYAQGSSHDEIAEILGLRSVSIRTLLLRARRKLARLLGGDTAESKETTR